MFASERRRVGQFNGLLLVSVVLLGSAFVAGCKRKAPVDRHLEQAYSLLQDDPKGALEALAKAQNPADPKVILGRGLAQEKLRQYGDAEKTLLGACAAQSQPVCWLSLGRVQVALGKLDDARRAIDRVVAEDQTELSALLLEAYLAHDDARARTALSHLAKWSEQARKENPPRAIPAEFYLAQVALFGQLRAKDDFVSAKAQAQKAKVSQSRGALGLVELAVKTGRTGLAVELLRKIADDRPSDDVRRQVAKLAHGLGDHRLAGDILDTLPGNDLELVTLRAEHDFATGRPEAVANLRRAIRLTKDATEQLRLRLLLAEANLQSGQLGDARADAEAVLKSGPNEAAILLLAQADLAESVPKAALERLAPLLDQPRVSAAARELAARAQLALGQRKEARSQLDAILLEQPAHARAARLRVALEVDGGQAAEAVRIAQELVGRAPSDPGLRLLLADAIRKAEGPEAATKVLQESTRALPGSVPLWMALIRGLEETKAEAEALAALEAAHQKLPGEGAFTAALATKLAKAGRSEEAARLYRELIQRAGNDPIALNNLAVIYADDLADPGQAVTFAERAYALSREPAIVDTLGWALYRRAAPGDLERARGLLESVRATLTSPSARYHLGAVLLATGAADEGRGLLSQALAQAEDFEGADHARTLLKAPASAAR